jgi:hypothetical protein
LKRSEHHIILPASLHQEIHETVAEIAYAIKQDDSLSRRKIKRQVWRRVALRPPCNTHRPGNGGDVNGYVGDPFEIDR